MTDLDELEKYAEITGHAFATVKSLFDVVGEKHRLMFLDDMSTVDVVLLASFLRIERTAIKFQMELPKPPFLGTLPTGRVNAMAVPVRQANDLILAFEAGMFPAVWFMGDILASIVSIDNEIGSAAPSPLSKEERSGAISWGAELIRNYLFLGNPFISRRLDLPRIQKGVSKLFSEFMTDFVVGHEFAHLAIHQSEHTTIRSINVVGSVRSDVLLPASHHCEFEADQVGMVLMSSSWLDRHQIPYWFTAPLAIFYFRFFQALYEAYEAISSHPYVDKEHPPIFIRIRTLVDSIPNLIPERHCEKATTWINVIEELTGDLTLQAISLSRDAASEGRSLSPIWNCDQHDA